MKYEHQEGQKVTSWCDNSNPTLSKPDMNGIVYNRSHSIACEGSKEDKGYNSVIDMIVFFEIWN